MSCPRKTDDPGMDPLPIRMVLNIMDRSSKLINNNSFQKNYPIHQMQENQGVTWIVIENGIVHDATNSYFEQIRQPNGDIYLRLIDIFKDTVKNTVTGNHHEANNQDYGE